MKRDKFAEIERRKFPRLNDSIFILARLRSSPEERFKAVARNIGMGGLMFEIERYIPPQSELEVEIYQPITGDKRMFFSIATLARVIWTRKIEKAIFEEGENRYRIGMEFSEMKEDDKQRIANYIEEKGLEIRG